MTNATTLCPTGQPTLRLRDPAALLRRLARRTTLRPPRLIGAVISVSRQYVVDAVDLPRGPGPPSRLHQQFADAIGAVLPSRTDAGGYALTLVHCRSGRVVWLPCDLARYELGCRLARARGLRPADQILLTEHGWRTLPTRVAASTPTPVPAR